MVNIQPSLDCNATLLKPKLAPLSTHMPNLAGQTTWSIALRGKRRDHHGRKAGKPIIPTARTRQRPRHPVRTVTRSYLLYIGKCLRLRRAALETQPPRASQPFSKKMSPNLALIFQRLFSKARVLTVLDVAAAFMRLYHASRSASARTGGLNTHAADSTHGATSTEGSVALTPAPLR